MKTSRFIQDFMSHTGFLKAFAMKLTRDKNLADDLYQETALSAIRHQDKFKENTNMKGWLSTIMKNSFINQFRKNQRRNQIQETTRGTFLMDHFEGTATNTGEMNINVTEIKQMIETLDEGYRKPFLMAFQGYQYDEIQVVMGNLPMGTIKSRIHHARKMLKHKINKTQGEVAA